MPQNRVERPTVGEESRTSEAITDKLDLVLFEDAHITSPTDLLARKTVDQLRSCFELPLHRLLHLLKFSQSCFLDLLVVSELLELGVEDGEIGIGLGQAVLFEGIDEEIDPMIDPVLEKNIVRQAGVDMLKLGDQEIEYNWDFRLYLTTKLANPDYTPEIFGKTMIINFSVTMEGLRDQLLNDVVQYERPELEEARKNLIVETS